MLVTLPVKSPPNVLTPDIAVAYNVPVKYPSLHLAEAPPRSLVVPDGTMSESTCAVIVMVSVVAVPRSVLPLTVRLPLVLMLPVLDATVNLSVVPDLTAKFASTFIALLNSDVPVTVKLPPSVVAPLFTFKVPVDCMSNPSPFLSCKSPAPSVHVDPLATPPVIDKLPVSDNPNFAHAAPVQYHPR